MRRVVFVSLATIAAIASAALAGPAPVALAAPALASATDDIDQQDPGGRQLVLTEFKAWLLDQPGIDTSGYVESINDSTTESTVLLWKGSSPLQSAAITEGANRGIRVSIQPRNYDLGQIDSAQRTIFANASQMTVFSISTVVGVQEDFDGVTIEGQYSAAASGDIAAATAAVQAFANAAATQTGVAVRVASGSGVYLAVATRSNDFAPFNAGGYMIGTDTNTGLVHGCSTGFSIRVNGVTHTTTARHCWYHNFRARDGAAKYGDGVVNSRDGAAREMSTTGSALMFDGAYNDSTGYHKTVTGIGAVSLHDSVCTSGGNSGVHCHVYLDQTGVMINDGFGLVSTIRGHQLTAGQIAAIQGDSGGPVLLTAGTGKVHAVGMIQAVQAPAANCGPVHDPGICSAYVLFTLTSVIIKNITGASLVTG